MNLFCSHLYFCCKNQISSYQLFQHYWGRFYESGTVLGDGNIQRIFCLKYMYNLLGDRTNSYSLFNNPSLCTRHFVKYFKSLILFNFYKNPRRYLLHIPFYRYNNLQPELLRVHSRIIEPAIKSGLPDPKSALLIITPQLVLYSKRNDGDNGSNNESNNKW